ncbi:MAG: hypothetical protein AAGC74_01915 [Verrucomicrobiota bacterium]
MDFPNFTSDGVLPTGDYEMTFPELKQSMLVLGKTGVTDKFWDTDRRLWLVEQTEILVNQLWQVGIENIFIDGSFTENKNRPGDIDGYFEAPWKRQLSRGLEHDLNLLSKDKIWTWRREDRRECEGKKRLPMWILHRVEFYPYWTDSPFPMGTGILDEKGKDLPFPKAFRRSRSGVEKGIVKIIR